MKRLLIILLALATALLFTVPAGAKKPDKPGKPDPEPNAGTTCVTPWWSGDIKDTDEDGWSNDFTLILDADHPDACIDVLTKVEGQWKVTVRDLAGDGLRSLLLVPRDAVAPGDSCGGERRRNAAVYDDWTLPHPDDPREWLPRASGVPIIAAATVNSCPGDDEAGVGFFAETVEWDINNDGVVDENDTTMEATGDPHPLALLVFTSGLKRSDVVAIHVDLPGTD